MGFCTLITGASSEVGSALLSRLLRRAAPEDRFAAHGNGDLGLLAPLMGQYPGRIHLFDADLTNPAALDALMEGVEGAVGAPSHLVHLPALPVVNTNFKHFNEARFTLDMQVQAGSAAALCRRFVPAMAKRRFGRVLFMLSSYVLGLPPKNTAAYVMAKEALHGLAKSLAADYAPHGVTVNCVAPSMMETRFLAGTPHLIVEAAAAANPMGRNATPEDVAPAMEFLLGEDAGFITGVVLPVTGGSA